MPVLAASTGTWAAVLAGGRGTRFWPRSRKRLPKQCLALYSERTLLQATVDRIRPLVPPERVLVMTGPDMVEAVREQLPEVPPENILVEPRPRNTAPCIGWAAVEVVRRGGDALVVLPSDHRIANEGEFRRVVAEALEASRARSAVVLLGQTPDSPHTGYGYLELGDAVGPEVLEVRRFVEKPNRARAEEMLRAGNVLWNGGMFVFSCSTLLAAYAEHLPLTRAALAAVERGAVGIDDVWDATDATSIDYGVLERLAPQNRLAIPCTFGWTDLGSWTALEEVLPSASLGVARARSVVAVDASGCVIDAPDKLVAAIGVRDLVVVDTGDVLLIAAKEASQRISELLDILARRGEEQYL